MPHIDGWWLAALAAVPVLIWFRKRWKAPPSIGYSSTGVLKTIPRSRRTRWRSAPFAARIACLVLVVLAMTRPRVGMEPVRHVGRGAAIEIVIDRSSSMDSDYGSTTEFSAAKEMASRFVLSRGSDLIGLTAFASQPRSISPLTFDHNALVRRLGKIDLASGDEDGTNIGGALMVAAARLKAADLGRASRVIVLFTDAESRWDYHLAEAAELMADWGVRLHVIHIDDGIPPSFGQRYAHEHGYDTETRLRRLAVRTGGTYSKPRDFDEMKGAGAAIDALEPADLPSMKFAGGSELFPALLLAAMLLLVLEAGASTLWLRSIP